MHGQVKRYDGIATILICRNGFVGPWVIQILAKEGIVLPEADRCENKSVRGPMDLDLDGPDGGASLGIGDGEGIGT